MKRLFIGSVCACCLTVVPSTKSLGQIPVLDIIKQGIKKVIKAVDLKIQRMQNETIWLQNGQRVIENKMHELKLTEISGWMEKQRKLYADYFEELWKVKSAIAYFNKVKDAINTQLQIVKEYKQALALLKNDNHFSQPEIDYAKTVYIGVLNESVKNLDQLYLIVNAFATQMSDASRLELLEDTNNRLEQNLADLRQFNTQLAVLGIQRSKDQTEIDLMKSLYGNK
jgi:hypothetical protein